MALEVLVGASHALLGISWMFLRFIRHAEDHPPDGAVANFSSENIS